MHYIRHKWNWTSKGPVIIYVEVEMEKKKGGINAISYWLEEGAKLFYKEV